MDFQDKRYVVGIDLGTTNTAVSYVDLAAQHDGGNRRSIRMFKIPQLTGAGEFHPVSVLPSFLYIPGEYDISRDALKHPWKREKDPFVGAFARDHGAALPSRLVSSAKSWLCHARADRKARILPWGSDGVEKVSPVEATAEYLRHIRKAWNHFVKDEDLFLENQPLVITVPASFDEAAREFTLEAARMAGLTRHLILLEEPLAAFYAWLIRHESDWQNHVRPDDLILVCDVGGGTTDFTLITLKASEGSPRFERLAVGHHLILGGDNIDLALARQVAGQFKGNSTLSADKWKTLCHQCRAAKEKILDQGQDKVRITLKGEGRSLIAGTLAADLTREAVEKILSRGFFPEDPDRQAPKKKGKAMAEFGLPYEQEPAVTRHIGWFLDAHRGDVKAALGKAPIPDLILFNGGTLKPEPVQEGIRRAVRHWFSDMDAPLPGVLENPEPDLSVALGAAYYGLVKQGMGVRVGSGSPRSYYIGVATEPAEPEPVSGSDSKADQPTGSHSAAGTVLPEAGQPDGPEPKAPGGSSSALCVVERGLDEGSTIDLPDKGFEVLTNQPVSFDMYSSTFRSGDRCGDVIPVDDSLTRMPPLQTVIRFGSRGEKRRIPVVIEPEYTELGTLAMWCRSTGTDHRWKLQFQLRDAPEAGAAKESAVYDEARVSRAVAQVKTAFSDTAAPKAVQRLTRYLEEAVEQKKGQWPLSFLRSLADTLLEHASARTLSALHEVRWLNLAGYCIRPGFGDAFDEERIRKLWKIYLGGLSFPKAPQNAVEWWIFCRRIAGGLSAGQQRQFFQDISPRLGGGKQGRMPPQEAVEMWMAAANMERLLVKDKMLLAKKLLGDIKPNKTPAQLLWVLSRLGARELLYGSVDRVVSANDVTVWVKRLMKMPFKQAEPQVAAVTRMVRKTGDRTRDVSDTLQEEVTRWLKKKGAGSDVMAMVHTHVPMDAGEENRMYGERLPQGLVIKGEKGGSDRKE